MLSCSEATKLLSEAQDQPLHWRKRMSLRLHTAMCSACRNFGQQLGDLRSLAREFKSVPNDEDQ